MVSNTGAANSGSANLFSELSRRGTPVAAQESVLQPPDVHLCFVDIEPQGGRFQPRTPVFQPRQLAGHFVERVVQGPDQLHGLGGIAVTHRSNRRTDRSNSEEARLPRKHVIARKVNTDRARWGSTCHVAGRRIASYDRPAASPPQYPWQRTLAMPTHVKPALPLRTLVGTEKARSSLMIGALGVVFGDLGTSPIYTIQTIFDPSDPIRYRSPRPTCTGWCRWPSGRR